MTITRCISSHLMTGLLTWRNPQGSEENFLPQQHLRSQRIPDKWRHVGKVLATEIGLCVLILMSVVETAVYSTFALASLPVVPVTERPYLFFVNQLQSSSFTVIWGLVDVTYYNFFSMNTFTDESFARFFAEQANPTPFKLYRPEDRSHLSEWQAKNGELSFLEESDES